MTFNTFLINLKRNTDRLAFMSTQLQKNEMIFLIQEGIDGRTYDFKDDYDEELSRKMNDGKALTRGHIGCSLSHKKIFEKMILENINYALVIEDDVELPEGFKKVVEKEVTKRISRLTSWDYLSFNYPPTGWGAIKSRILSLGKMSREIFSGPGYLYKLAIYYLKSALIILMFIAEGIRDGFYKRMYPEGKAVKYYRPTYLTGCYLISQAGAKKLLAVNNKIIYSADRLPNVARLKTGLKFYVFLPLLVNQKNNFISETGY